MIPPNFEDDLRRRLHGLADHAPSDPQTSPQAGEDPTRLEPYAPPASKRPTRNTTVALAAAIVVVASALVAVAVRAGENDSNPQVVTDTTVAPTVSTTSSTSTSTTGPPPSVPAPTGSVTTIPTGPGYGVTFPAMAWTGQELIVWGGEVVSEQQWSNAGGAYDPATSTWRELAPSPLPPMSEHTAVWTGYEVIICCGRVPSGSGAVAAAYRPDTDTWRTLAPPPFDGAPFAQSVWTGTEMIVTGGSHYRGAAAYDPSSDTWRTLTDPPGTIERVADSGWTGQRLVVWNRGKYSTTAGYTYDPASDTWEQLPEMPEEFRFEGGTAAIVGDDLIVWGAESGSDNLAYPTGAVLDLREWRWRALPPAPAEPSPYDNGSFTSPSSVSTGTEAIIFGSIIGGGYGDQVTVPVLAFNPETESWRLLGNGPQWYNAPMIWADGTAFAVIEPPVAIAP